MLKLVNILGEIHSSGSYLIPSSPENFGVDRKNNFLVDKTIDRINSLKSITDLGRLIDCDNIIVNGKSYRSFDNL